MKTIGLIGGMSWESSTEYYRIVNETVKAQLGGFHSAKCILYSVDFHEVEVLQANAEWERSGQMMAQAAAALERAGADFVVLCTNTMHKVIGQIEASVAIPVLHIADVTAAALQAAGVGTAALLGTRFTMEQDFYRGRLERHGLQVIVPEPAERQLIHDVIYNELCLGQIEPESKRQYLQIIERLRQQGAEGVILGCTEIGLLVKQGDAAIPLFDTSLIHAREAALLALK